MTRGIIAVLAIFIAAAVVLEAGLMVDPAAAQTATAKKKKGLKGAIGRPAYSYSKSAIIGTETRRFTEPGYSRQTPSGPFDNGFFFDSAIGRNGGESPYMQ